MWDDLQMKRFSLSINHNVYPRLICRVWYILAGQHTNIHMFLHVWMKHFLNLLHLHYVISKRCNMHGCIRILFRQCFTPASNKKKNRIWFQLGTLPNTIGIHWWFRFFFWHSFNLWILCTTICFIHFDFGFIATLLRTSIWIYIQMSWSSRASNRVRVQKNGSWINRYIYSTSLQKISIRTQSFISGGA